MEQKKNDSEILAEIYRNAQIALTSISDIMPEVEDGGIREGFHGFRGTGDKLRGAGRLLHPVHKRPGGLGICRGVYGRRHLRNEHKKARRFQ